MYTIIGYARKDVDVFVALGRLCEGQDKAH